MRNKKFIIIQCTALAMAMALAGCGGQAYDEKAATATPAAPAAIPASPAVPTVEVGDPINALPAIANSFSVYGSGTTTAPLFQITNVDTDNLLKVKITPYAAGPIATPSGVSSNFSATYNCVSYKVKVKYPGSPNGGLELPTKNINLGSMSPSPGCQGGSTTAQGSDIIDFSGYMASGHGAVTVQVYAARYDYYCNLLMQGAIPLVYSWSWYYSNYCTNMYPVLSQHNTSGLVQVQVNGTSFN